MEKLLDDEVLCRRRHSELVTHVDKPLTSNHLDISFIEFYKDQNVVNPLIWKILQCLFFFSAKLKKIFIENPVLLIVVP